jgi:diaminopimelate decarboxylase
MRPFFSLKSLPQRIWGQGLCVDGLPLQEVLLCERSPVYVTSLRAVGRKIQQYRNALSASCFSRFRILYALKANFASPVLQEVLRARGGFDLVSRGEWRAALQAGALGGMMCFSGVGKHRAHWQEALQGGVGFCSVEHLCELEDMLNFVHSTAFQAPGPRFFLRLNPCLNIQTHPYLKTGTLNSKFGIVFSQFQKWFFEKKASFQNRALFLQWIAPLQGVHVHVGSQVGSQDILPSLMASLLSCAQFLAKQGVCVSFLNVGGGLLVESPAYPVSDDGADIEAYVHRLSQEFQKAIVAYPRLQEQWGPRFERLEIFVEPGRSVVARSTIFLTQVLFLKKNARHHAFCVVDGAMNDFPRPSMYNAVHGVQVVNFAREEGLSQRLERARRRWNVVGPVCESGDFLAKNVLLPSVEPQDTLAFFEAGAYCRSLASTYNLRPLPAEIFIKEGAITHKIG